MSVRLRGPKNDLMPQESVDDRPETKKSPKILPEWRDRNIFLGILAFRLVNAFTTKTFFQADEFFQLLEPAHKLVFGYGYITWEWHEKLRSSIHPLIFALAYKCVLLLSLTLWWEKLLVVATPKIVGAIIATISELFLYKFVQNYTKNEDVSRIALFVSLTNPFNWFFSTRSFLNNFEAMITTVALSYWPWYKSSNIKSQTLANLFQYYLGALADYFPYYLGVLSCIVRPTNSVLWGCVGVWTIVDAQSLLEQLTIVVRAIVAGSFAIIQTIILDYFYYSEWTLPLYNFIEFNVIKSLSKFYGVAPWHFYIFQALPMMTLTYLPFLLHHWWGLFGGGVKNLSTIVCIVVISVFSAIDHKEIRFICPLMPFLTLSIATSVKLVLRLQVGPRNLHRTAWWKALMSGFFLVNIGIALFFTRVHERGVIDVINYLTEDDEVSSFGFLTPCHLTPWQSHLHSPKLNSNSWFLTCEPPLHLSDASLVTSYRDESDQFYDDPDLFFQRHFPSAFSVPTEGLMQQQQEHYHHHVEDNDSDSDFSNKIYDDAEPESTKKHAVNSKPTRYSWPSRLVIFQPMERYMDKKLQGKYYQCHRFFNSYFHWDSRRSGDVIVYCPVSAWESSVDN